MYHHTPFHIKKKKKKISNQPGHSFYFLKYAVVPLLIFWVCKVFSCKCYQADILLWLILLDPALVIHKQQMFTGLFFTFLLALWAIKFVVGCVFVRSSDFQSNLVFSFLSWFFLPWDMVFWCGWRFVAGFIYVCSGLVQPIQDKVFVRWYLQGTLYFCLAYWNYGSFYRIHECNTSVSLFTK